MNIGLIATIDNISKVSVTASEALMNALKSVEKEFDGVVAHEVYLNGLNHYLRLSLLRSLYEIISEENKGYVLSNVEDLDVQFFDEVDSIEELYTEEGSEGKIVLNVPEATYQSMIEHLEQYLTVLKEEFLDIDFIPTRFEEIEYIGEIRFIDGYVSYIVDLINYGNNQQYGDIVTQSLHEETGQMMLSLDLSKLNKSLIESFHVEGETDA